MQYSLVQSFLALILVKRNSFPSYALFCTLFIMQMQSLLKRFEPYLAYPHDSSTSLPPSELITASRQCSDKSQSELITASRQCSDKSHGSGLITASRRCSDKSHATVSSSGTVACIYHQTNPIYAIHVQGIKEEDVIPEARVHRTKSY